ncbi:MAG: DUF6790 family protein [Methyloceanibacter sp.]|uniref:DUF6790 family protein n=1 Tax=Methyloceanibacter sp. TaxID=1965321 RepID=UPI003D6CF319
MYLVAIVLLMLVLPVASVAAEMVWHPGAASLMALIGKWFTFWGVGVRLFMAGVMQTLRPRFTAESIFDIGDPASLAIVREVGFGNLAIGTLGLASLAQPKWVVPAALAGGLYYGLAGAGHLMRKTRNAKEQVALVSDLAIFFVLAVFVVDSLI